MRNRALWVFGLLFSFPALAHHLTGRLPATFAEGLASGLMHCVLGSQHLLALLAVGLVSAGVAARGIRLGVVVALATVAVAFTFHGVAYDELIAGIGAAALSGYIVGFLAAQMVVILSARALGRRAVRTAAAQRIALVAASFAFTGALVGLLIA